MGMGLKKKERKKNVYKASPYVKNRHSPKVNLQRSLSRRSRLSLMSPITWGFEVPVQNKRKSTLEEGTPQKNKKH